MVGRQADILALSAADRTFLESQVRRHKAPRSLSDRCRMVLLCADGLQSKEVAERLGVHEHTVGKWRRRFAQAGIEGLTDEYRAGRPRTVSDAQVAQVIERTLNTTSTEHRAEYTAPCRITRRHISNGCRNRTFLRLATVVLKTSAT